MEPITEGMTWREIIARFDQDAEYSMSAKPHLRRVKPWKRKKGETEDRTVVRLIVQKAMPAGTRTIYKKNMRDLSPNFLDEPADAKIIEKINATIASLETVQ